MQVLQAWREEWRHSNISVNWMYASAHFFASRRLMKKGFSAFVFILKGARSSSLWVLRSGLCLKTNFGWLWVAKRTTAGRLLPYGHLQPLLAVWHFSNKA